MMDETKPGAAQGPGMRDLLERLRDYLDLNRKPGNDLNPKFSAEISAALGTAGAVEAGLCPGGIDPGFDECPKCGATDDDECRGAPSPAALDPATVEALKLAHKALTPFALSPGAISLSSALGHIERQHLLDAVQAIEAIQATLSASNADPSTSRVMQAAESAQKVVDGWSDSKREYADRVTGPQSQTSRVGVDMCDCGIQLHQCPECRQSRDPSKDPT